MRFSRNQTRAIYAGLIIVAFFIPAHGDTSAFGFLKLAINSIGSDTELTVIDLMVFLIPLLLIPATATIVLVRALQNKALNSLLLGLPFFSLTFFFLIFSFDVNWQGAGGNALSLLLQMSIGFYTAVVASLLLLLSYSKREALNLSPRRR